MSDNKFVKAYDELMEHLYEIMDDTLHSVSDALEIAKEKTSELGGLTQEEVNQVADFLMRDIEHAANTTPAVSDKDSLAEWFKFDIELIENFALDTFTSIADKTRIELAKIENQANKFHSYHSGEITGPGTFHCDNCGKQIAFKSTSEIPECPKCKEKTFSRS
jgi:phosphoserine phosphatase